jgi:hypothetical protein
VDVARYGDDKTVFTRIFGAMVQLQEAVNKKDTNFTTGRIIQLDNADKYD